jgi:hypothetical protein
MGRNLCKGAFIENYTHPCVIAADHLMCSRPQDVLICNTYCTFDRVCRTTMPDTQQRRQPQASSVEGYYNANDASNASTCINPCIDTSVACIYFSWQQAAQNSQEQ